MEIQEVASGVHHVTANRVNWQLIEEGDSVTVVDAGWPRDYELVVSSLAQIGHSPASVAGILITHGHLDHIGCAEEMRVRHEIASHVFEDEAPLALGEIHESMKKSWAIMRMWKPKVFRFNLLTMSRGVFSAQPLKEVQTFSEAETIDLPGSPRPFHTPGHTSGSCSYLLEDRGVLITGDALVSMELWTERVEVRLMPAEFNSDHDRARLSLAIIESLKADMILTGHGPPYPGEPAMAVREAREHD